MELKRSSLSQVVLYSRKYLNHAHVQHKELGITVIYYVHMQSLTYVDAELWSCTCRNSQQTI